MAVQRSLLVATCTACCPACAELLLAVRCLLAAVQGLLPVMLQVTLPFSWTRKLSPTQSPRRCAPGLQMKDVFQALESHLHVMMALLDEDGE